MVKKCICCGNEFKTSHQRQKYCGFDCRVKCIPKGVDIVGNVYGKLTVIQELEPVRSKKGIPQRSFLCKCICGKTIERLSKSLVKNSKLASCGCQLKFRKSGTASHRLTHTRIYRVWHSMKMRCYSEKCPSYVKYGAVGIKVCDRWLESFENFYEDMGATYHDGLTLDRYPNQKGNYEPSNCRWATYKEQNRNLKSNRFLVVGKYKKCISEFAEVMGYPSSGIIRGRLCLGWSDEEAVLGRKGGKYFGSYQTIEKYYESKGDQKKRSLSY